MTGMTRLAPPDEREDDPLYLVAWAVEQDADLSAEMAEWDVTVGDGLWPERSLVG